MQLHYGVMRDNNKKQFIRLGADTGFDSIGDSAPISKLAAFLNSLVEKDALPKTILYSLNPMDNAAIDTLMGCFQDGTYLGRIQHGAAWWFNDNRQGITEHLTSLANLGVLSNFIGMLTDSRSFLSYTRHDYFRRILCEFIGNLVENGEYPKDYNSLGKIVQNISYYNAKEYFGF
jgi:glucuronate isomerase